MHKTSLARMLLVPCLLIAAASCGGAPGTQATARPTVRILSPATGSSLVTSNVETTVTVRLSVSHFTLVKAASGDQPGSGQVWLYENGKLAAELSANSIPLDLIPGSYLFKAVLVTNGRVVATSAPAVVSLSTIQVSNTATPPPVCQPTATRVTQTANPAETVSISPVCLPTGISFLSRGDGYFIPPVPDSHGNLWFAAAAANTAADNSPSIGRITPAGAISLFLIKGLPAGTRPRSLVYGLSGNLWFVNYGTSALDSGKGPSTIGRVTPSGTISLFSKGLPAGNFLLGSLVPDPQGGVWFDVFSASYTGEVFIGRITSSGAIALFSKGLPSTPCPYLGNLTPGPGGDLWFPWGSSGCTSPSTPGTVGIGKITSSGTISLFSHGLPGGSEVGSLILGPSGNLWFTVQLSNNGPFAIGRITSTGAITLFSKGLPSTPCPYLGNLTPGPGGDLWFTWGNTGCTNASAAGIGKVTPSGTIFLFLTKGPPRNLGHLVAGPGGDLWFTVSRTSSTTTPAIGRISPSGTISLFSTGLPAGSYASSLLAGPGGSLWFTLFSGSWTAPAAIGRITPSGTISVFPTRGPPAGICGFCQSTFRVSGPGGDLWFFNGNPFTIDRITVSAP